MAGQYYFLNEYNKTSSRTAYNYVMFAAYIGALSGLVMKLFNHCAKKINSNEIKYKLIKNHYMLKSKKKLKRDFVNDDRLSYLQGVFELKFSFLDRFTFIRNQF